MSLAMSCFFQYILSNFYYSRRIHSTLSSTEIVSNPLFLNNFNSFHNDVIILACSFKFSSLRWIVISPKNTKLNSQLSNNRVFSSCSSFSCSKKILRTDWSAMCNHTTVTVWLNEKKTMYERVEDKLRNYI